MISNHIHQSNTGIQQSLNSSLNVSLNTNTAHNTNSTAGLEKGQLIRGEITDIKNNEVTVKLEDGRTLTGKLEDSQSLSIGDKVVFRVEDVSLKNLTLKIIANTDYTSLENTVEKALEAAGLSKNSRNSSIVKELLNQQMSIDQRTISFLIQQSVLHKDTSIQDLVLMNKYQIPVNEANIRQFNAYQTAEHGILKEIASFADSITELFTPKSELPYTDYLNLSSSLLRLLLNQNPESTGTALAKNGTAVRNAADTTQGNLSSAESLTENNTIYALKTGSILSREDALNLVSVLRSVPDINHFISSSFLSALSDGSADILDTAKLLNHLLNAAEESPLNSESLARLAASPAFNTIQSAREEIMGGKSNINLSFQERTLLSNALKAFLPENIFTPNERESFASLNKNLLTGNIAAEEILTWIQDNLDKGEESSLKTLLSSNEFKLLLKEELMNKWTLEPKNLTQSEDINRHFESILNQMNDLKEFMEQNGGKNSLNQSAEGSHLQENVNFMHTLNEFFTYVQIPLKLKKQFANSELYVYSKQKPGRTAADGIRVLLHLDMDHLGPLDIYLDLHDNNLAAKFYLDHTDTMNLIHSNLFLLEDVLKSKGYSLNTEVLKREKAVNVVEDFLKADSQTASVTRYNFDLRA